ncbi:squalene/phytoene synthase family protein [Limosilactobacillus fermentum]|uniref:squalene/phytoene synthase family protein n=1 Tax=Limosilactobacillus fermentum TaxID=1613 RepID=UPI0030B942BE
MNTLSELENYCYQVAGTVGCMVFCILSRNSIENNRKSVINGECQECCVKRETSPA